VKVQPVNFQLKTLKVLVSMQGNVELKQNIINNKIIEMEELKPFIAPVDSNDDVKDFVLQLLYVFLGVTNTSGKCY
jgi:hypothetical protein